MSAPWRLERRVGTAQELHDLDLDAPDPSGGAPVEPAPEEPAQRVVRWNQVEDASLVVGSAQPVGSIDPSGVEAAGLTLARRRSGGGAVLLVPGAQAWVDVFLPAGDPLWCDDVDRSAWWLGDVWTSAIEALRPELTGRLSVHRSPSTDPASGRVACFASVGPGEVLLDGRKLVGVSQRRTRRWARFQCVVNLRWDPTPILRSLSADGRTESVVDGLSTVATIDDGRPSSEPMAEWSVVEAFHSFLPV